MSKINKENKINPAHYKRDKIETIDVIEGFDLQKSFNLGNVCKYLLRAGKKNKETYKEDLEKAQWYLSREINSIK